MLEHRMNKLTDVGTAANAVWLLRKSTLGNKLKRKDLVGLSVIVRIELRLIKKITESEFKD